MPIVFDRTQGRVSGPGTARRGIIRPEWRDRYRRYVSDNPSPEKFATLLRNAETDIGSLAELQEEIEAKNGHVRGVATTRRQAFCGLDWDIEADPEAQNQVFAGVVAKRIKADLQKVKVVYPQSGLKPGGFPAGKDAHEGAG